MTINPRYEDQVKFLLDVLPFVTEEACFALKGGTAINLFEWDLPRLSVDIDLTYLPVEDRDTSLTSIARALDRIGDRIRTSLPSARAELVPQTNDPEAKLHCQRYRTQVKIEVNTVLRGHLLPTRSMACSEQVQTRFERFVETTVLSRGELFGGKICAALDRQHPRDLFDVKRLLDNDGHLSDDIKQGMIAGLVSHKRPIAELISGNPKDQKQAFASQFEGMSFLPFTYVDHSKTLERLRSAIAATLNDDDRTFLMSFSEGAPVWTCFPIPELQAMPGPAWKLKNINDFRDRDPNRHQKQILALKDALKAPV